MLRGTVAALLLVALLLPLGVTAQAGPGGSRALPGGSGLPSGGPIAGPGAGPGAGPNRGATPSTPAPGPGAREIPGGPLPGKHDAPGGRAPNARSGAGDRVADPVRPGQTGPEATRDPTSGPRGVPSLGLARRAPSLSIRRDPRTAGAPPGSAPAPRSSPLVTLSGHSVRARIVDGVAVTELEQVFHNSGGRIAQGTWSCPLPPGGVVTGFSIFINGTEHPGRFMLRSEARRIYDETVRSRMDPGIVELHEGNLVVVQIFPIPAKGDMRIRMTWAHPLPDSGSASHYVAPLKDLAPADAPPIANVNLAVDVESDWTLRRVLTPEISLAAEPTASDTRWRGIAALEDCRPEADLEVGYLVDATDPHVAVRTESGGDGTRTFLAVVQAGSEPLTNLHLDFTGGRVVDQFPRRIGDLAPRERVLVFGRLAGGGGTATVRARSGRDTVVLPTKVRRGDEGFVRALWGVRKLAEMEEQGTPEADLVDLAEEAGILTRHNAILAEE